MLAFLFLDDVVYDPTDVAKVLDDEGLEVVAAAREALGGARRVDGPPRSTRRCAAKLVDELGLKPRNAFGPVRVAVTGRRVSPPLFESLELLGREESLARLDAAPARHRDPGLTMSQQPPPAYWQQPPPPTAGAAAPSTRTRSRAATR